MLINDKLTMSKSSIIIIIVCVICYFFMIGASIGMGRSFTQKHKIQKQQALHLVGKETHYAN